MQEKKKASLVFRYPIYRPWFVISNRRSYFGYRLDLFWLIRTKNNLD